MLCKLGHLERIDAYSEKLEEFDELANKALKERKSRYKEWKDREPRPAPPTGVRFWAKPRKEPTRSRLVAAYDIAGGKRVLFLISLISSDPLQDLAVRRCISKAEVARCSFKDKVIAQVDVISFTMLSFFLANSY